MTMTLSSVIRCHWHPIDDARAGLVRLIGTLRAIKKRDDILPAAERCGVQLGRVLNVGSKNVRYGGSCTNLDIVPSKDVDVVGDAHELASHFSAGSFDTVVLCGVLQYCKHPAKVVEQAGYVLRPGGILLLDAPFIQQYCADGVDLWRFTADGLKSLCEPHFTVLEIRTSIDTVEAIRFLGRGAVSTINNRIYRLTFECVVSLLSLPLRWLAHSDQRTAGALLLIGRKPIDKSPA